jgi:5'-methylthioadenosine phosphorylase
MALSKIGIIGGSGIYGLEGLKKIRESAVKTPFGRPSDRLMTGEFEGVQVVFLPRHGRGHAIPPHQVNYRANVAALKMLGVSRVVSVSAVGSMREQIAPGHLVVPHQYFDRTVSRARTFFEDGLVAHVAFAEPVCTGLAASVAAAARATGATVHEGGTYICIEGPTFSTRAESLIFRQWGMDVIGMTALPEARLAREAGMCYATLALSTDYDCWHAVEEDVSATLVLDVMAKNVAKAREVVRLLIPEIAKVEEGACRCHGALDGAIVTDPRKITPAARKRLAPIAGKYLAVKRGGK